MYLATRLEAPGYGVMNSGIHLHKKFWVVSHGGSNLPLVRQWYATYMECQSKKYQDYGMVASDM